MRNIKALQMESTNLRNVNDMTSKIKNLTRKEAEQIIHLMSWVVEDSNSELLKKDFERLSDRLMDVTREQNTD